MFVIKHICIVFDYFRALFPLFLSLMRWGRGMLSFHLYACGDRRRTFGVCENSILLIFSLFEVIF